MGYARRQLITALLTANAVRPLRGEYLSPLGFAIGWPTGELAPQILALTALDTAQAVVRGKAGRVGLALAAASAAGLTYLIRDARKAGEIAEQQLTETLGADYVDKSLEGASDFMMGLQHLTTEMAWGYSWARPTLDRKIRSAMTLGMLTALGRTQEVKLHVRGAINNGFTPEDIKEMLIHAAAYCGVPASLAIAGFNRCQIAVVANREAGGLHDLVHVSAEDGQVIFAPRALCECPERTEQRHQDIRMPGGGLANLVEGEIRQIRKARAPGDDADHAVSVGEDAASLVLPHRERQGAAQPVDHCNGGERVIDAGRKRA